MDDLQSLNWTLINQMVDALTPEQRDAAEWRIAHSGKIAMQDFQTSIGVLFVLASVAFIGRILIRIGLRQRIFLDDGFLIVSFASLIASTAIFYKRARIIYLVFALMGNDQVVSLIATQELDDIPAQASWSFAYMTFLWTTIFMVKFCYFAFFRTLLLSMPRAWIRYYWFSVVFSTISWLYMILQQLITCPYFGESASRCIPDLPISRAALTFTFWSGPILDALTDIAIISIPILVLRRSQMALLTKIGLGVFLCLSLFMLVCSIVRAAGMYNYRNGTLDVPWGVFWLHAEACIGVVMGSITVYRSVLVDSTSASSNFRRFVDKVIQMRTSERMPEEPKERSVPARVGSFLVSKIPNTTLTGLANMLDNPETPVRGHGKRNNMSTLQSTRGLEEMDYHDYLKRGHSVDTSTDFQVAPCSREASWVDPDTWSQDSLEEDSPGRSSRMA